MPAVQGQSSLPPAVPSNPDIERLTKIYEGAHDKALAYSKVILGLGYAALFTVWSGTREQLTYLQVVLSALLALVSVSFYVLFEIGQMFTQNYLSRNLSRLLSQYSGNPRLALIEHDILALKISRRFQIVWYAVLLLTIPTGFGAFAILVWAFITRLRALH